MSIACQELSTGEGKSNNPTKSLCSQYVFNSGLTCSKSLIACPLNEDRGTNEQWVFPLGVLHQTMCNIILNKKLLHYM